jgi:hypothetical protein
MKKFKSLHYCVQMYHTDGWVDTTPAKTLFQANKELKRLERMYKDKSFRLFDLKILSAVTRTD